jgi:pyridoxamine 5'-phosphate oxidase
VSPQSQIISSRDVLEQNLIIQQEKFRDTEVIPLPDYWGGYRLQPLQIEFWQGRANRLHDRLLFSDVESKWKLERLAP